MKPPFSAAAFNLFRFGRSFGSLPKELFGSTFGKLVISPASSANSCSVAARTHVAEIQYELLPSGAPQYQSVVKWQL
jgi:hypothetical protein